MSALIFWFYEREMSMCIANLSRLPAKFAYTYAGEGRIYYRNDKLFLNS